MEAAIRSERGNALFLILIAVALFAALSYAVTQSSRGGGSGVDKEKAELVASRAVQFATSVRNAAMRMSIRGETNIIFASNILTPCHSGTNCIFAPEGGGLTWPGNAFTNTLWARYYGVGAVNLEGIGTTAPDHALNAIGIDLDVCEAINDGLGLTNPPVQDDALGTVDMYPGEPLFCYEENAGGTYGFMFVVEAK